MEIRFTHHNVPAGEEAVRELEAVLGYSLPPDDRTFLRESNGGMTYDYEYTIPEIDEVDDLAELLGIGAKYGIVEMLREPLEMLDELTIPIGNSSFGNYILMRPLDGAGSVWYWDRNGDLERSGEEGDCYFLADSFTEFCNSLRDAREV